MRWLLLLQLLQLLLRWHVAKRRGVQLGAKGPQIDLRLLMLLLMLLAAMVIGDELARSHRGDGVVERPVEPGQRRQRRQRSAGGF